MLYSPTIEHFFLIVGLLVATAIASFVLHLFRAPRMANAVSHGMATLAALFGVIFSLAVLQSGSILTASFASPFPILTYSLRIDALSAFFVLIISLAGTASSLYGFGYVRREAGIRPGVFGFFYALFIASLFLVVSANNGIFFLIVWELMSLSSYFLIVHEHHHTENVQAGFMYFLMTHIGTAFLTFAIVLLGQATGSYDFDAIRTFENFTPLVHHGVLMCALVGLGIKAGIVPLHVWLPLAHPAAPSHVSALLSGVMLKVAIFMLIRFFFDFMGLPGTIWWGVTILVLGAVSALLGVLYALSEHDLKRLLAYHSVENLGIILLGIGSALIFAGKGAYTLAGVALIAGLFHTLNHAIFKGLLFLGAGSVVQTCGTRNMEKYGGLIRILPVTATLFLVGSLAIAGLPPFNGFASEWLTFEALILGVTTSSLYLKALFVVSIGFLALTSGLAAACFVKAVGITFLARPRSTFAENVLVREPLSMKVGMGILALLSLVLGIFADRVFALIKGVLPGLGLETTSSEVFFAQTTHLTATGTYAISLPLVALCLAGALVIVAGFVYLVTSSRRTTRGALWACGAPMEHGLFAGPSERAEITATGFGRTLMVIFRRLVKTKVTNDERGVEVHMIDYWRAHLYLPVARAGVTLSSSIRKLQSGNVNTYLLYMFLALCTLLLTTL
jgi:hydrogenase-4 component B